MDGVEPIGCLVDVCHDGISYSRPRYRLNCVFNDKKAVDNEHTKMPEIQENFSDRSEGAADRFSMHRTIDPAFSLCARPLVLFSFSGATAGIEKNGENNRT